MLLDPQFAEEMEAQRAREGKAAGRPQPVAPPQALWSAEVAVMTEIKDLIKSFEHQMMAVALAKAGKSAGEAPKPSPRPRTAFGSAKLKAELSRHDKLKAKLLPEKYGNSDPVE